MFISNKRRFYEYHNYFYENHLSIDKLKKILDSLSSLLKILQ